MKLALDTNAYVSFCRGDKMAADAVQAAEKVFLPFAVLGELRAGFLMGNQSQVNQRNLVRFLNSERVEPLFADEDTTHHYGRTFMQLRKQGTPIPINDVWIASLVIQHNLYLLSRDRHFDFLPQLMRV